MALEEVRVGAQVVGDNHQEAIDPPRLVKPAPRAVPVLRFEPTEDGLDQAAQPVGVLIVGEVLRHLSPDKPPGFSFPEFYHRIKSVISRSRAISVEITTQN